MKRIKRILSLLLVIIMIPLSISISGCFRKYDLETITMMSQAYYAIPDAPNEPHSLQSKYIETDNYGRTLFRFSSGGFTAFCILQESDEKYVYYYDNVSFMIEPYDYNRFDPHELDALKEANDWNEKLDESRMIKRELLKSSLSRKRDSAIDREYAYERFNVTIHDKDDISGSACFVDYDQTGKELFYVERVKNVSTTGGYKYELFDRYLMILNADGSYDADNYIVKIDDWEQINTPLAEIKDKNGWMG